MAVQTKRLANADDGRVLWEFSYDDVSLLVTQFRCVNGSTQAALGRLWRLNDPSVSYTKRTDPGATDVIPVSSGQANRLQLTVLNTSHGPILDGLDGEFTWPVT